jgi:toxin ParE1/3/4
MARRVRWTPAAIEDLNEAAEYIARDSRYYAAAFVRKMKIASRSLSSMSLRARRVPEYNQDNLRELLLGNYRLIFRILDDEIQIISVINQARDLQSHLN